MTQGKDSQRERLPKKDILSFLKETKEIAKELAELMELGITTPIEEAALSPMLTKPQQGDIRWFLSILVDIRETCKKRREECLEKIQRYIEELANLEAGA